MDFFRLSKIFSWLLDPLNPHAIAETRSGALLRSTSINLARCLVDWADAELARDTNESRARATGLYTQAQSLLAPLDGGQKESADFAVPAEWRGHFASVQSDLAAIRDLTARREALEEVRGSLKSHDGWDIRIERARTMARRARQQQPAAPAYS